MDVADGDDGAEIEFAIEVRKQFAVARGLPAQRVAERIGIDLDQEQTGLAKEMLAGRLGDLRRGGEMDEAVAQVVGAAAIHTLTLGLAPGRSGRDFVDPAHGLFRLVVESSGFSRKRPERRQTVKAAGRQLKRPPQPPPSSEDLRETESRNEVIIPRRLGGISDGQASGHRAMLTHGQIWTALDRLAERAGLSPSGLARAPGLDPTTFNKSKRITADGRERWPSTESVAKALAATNRRSTPLCS